MIRAAQMEVLRRAAIEQFEERAAAHLSDCFPEECEQMGAEPLRRLVHSGVHRAAEQGIEVERDVLRFLNLLIALGEDFGPQARPWAAEILSRNGLNAEQKVDLLEEHAIEELLAAEQNANHAGQAAGS